MSRPRPAPAAILRNGRFKRPHVRLVSSRFAGPAAVPLAHRIRGFTLVEVLVALAIVGVALLAGLKATGALTVHAQRQTDVLLAQLCAENTLHQIRLARQMPGVGETRRECLQAGQTFVVVLNVQATPNPNFVRVDAQVRNAEAPVLRLSTIVGRN